jgi:non-specific serine/threonine protein kinase
MSAPRDQAPLVCSPEPRLSAGAGAPSGVCEAFASGDAAGVLYLSTAALKDSLPPELVWARDWGRLFFTQLCQTRDPGAVAPPSEISLQAALQAAPPMPGAEYLSEGLLVRVWEELREAVSVAAARHAEGLAGWLHERSALWHLVGRVTFHLAENKRNETQPFAFMATYTDQLTGAGQLQHTPLGRALQNYAAQKNQPLLDALLQPVRAASQRSKLVRGLLESRRLFQALAWTPQEAFAFLRLVVKLPDWWKRKGPSRPAVTITLDAAKAGGVGLNAMLSFKVEASLDGARLTPEEWAQIQASPSGLVNLRGQWVELDAEQLGRVMEHWQQVQAAHQSGIPPPGWGRRLRPIWIRGVNGLRSWQANSWRRFSNNCANRVRRRRLPDSWRSCVRIRTAALRGCIFSAGWVSAPVWRTTWGWEKHCSSLRCCASGGPTGRPPGGPASWWCPRHSLETGCGSSAGLRRT